MPDPRPPADLLEEQIQIALAEAHTNLRDKNYEVVSVRIEWFAKDGKAQARLIVELEPR
jgi:hypothetical protein